MIYLWGMEETITYHTCIKCGEEKPLTSEYFCIRNTKFGFNKQCKSCQYKKSNEWVRNNIEKREKHQTNMREVKRIK